MTINKKQFDFVSPAIIETITAELLARQTARMRLVLSDIPGDADRAQRNDTTFINEHLKGFSAPQRQDIRDRVDAELIARAATLRP